MRKKLLLFILMCSSVAVKADVIGRMANIQGEVKDDSRILGKTLSLKLGEDVSETDTVMLGASGKAKIMLEDESELNLFAKTKLEIEHATELHLLAGKMRVILKQPLVVTTPNARIDAKSGDFLVEIESKKTKLIVFKGSQDSTGEVEIPKLTSEELEHVDKDTTLPVIPPPKNKSAPQSRPSGKKRRKGITF